MRPESIELPSGPAPVIWRRSARARRISLRIEPRLGGVIVTLPPQARPGAGIALLQAHQDWVAERLAKLPKAVTLRPGATVPLDGKPFRILHRPDRRGTVWLDGEAMHVAGELDFLPRRIVDFMRQEARLRLGRLAAEKAAAAGLGPRRVVIRDTSSRWGSCTSAGVLMFSWRLVMAPREVQDYVVGHELAHLRHMDHSRAFWTLAETLTPHRISATAWLRKHGAGLMRVG